MSNLIDCFINFLHWLILSEFYIYFLACYLFIATIAIFRRLSMNK